METPEPFSIGTRRRQERGWMRMLASMPAIYSMVVPLAVIDLSTQLYQTICFRLYDIPLVDRKRFVRLGHRGAHLPWFDRVHCAYCAYANGTILFVQTVVAETEKYWCPIRHSLPPPFTPPPHHKSFVKDGDVVALKKKMNHPTTS